MESKTWYTSKTLWFNIITVLIGVVEVISQSFPIPAEFLMLMNGLGNLFLRMITNQPISTGSK